MDGMLEIKMLKKYVNRLEREIRKIRGNTPSTEAWLEMQMDMAGEEAEREHRNCGAEMNGEEKQNE